MTTLNNDNSLRFFEEVGEGLDITPNKTYPVPNSVMVHLIDNPFYFCGPTLGRNPVSNIRGLTASVTKFEDYQDGVLYHQIIRIPLSVNPGFIVDDEDFDLELWNTHNVDVSCTDIDFVVSGTGLNLASSSPPFTINKFGSEEMVLTIYQTGPPVQDTTIEFTIDGVIVSIDVDAIRVVAVAFEPNWANRVAMDYVFESVVHQTERYVEQRRPLMITPKRAETFVIVEKDYTAQRFFNLVQYGKDKVFALPIFNEVFGVTNATQSDVVIGTAVTVTNLWNLNNQCDYVLFFDFVSYDYEVKELSSIAANSITLASGLASTYNIDHIVAYPAFLSVLESVRWKGKVENFDLAQIKFSEI